MEIRVTRIHLRKYADRGYQISIPRVYVDDLGLDHGDEMDVYRTENGELVIRPAASQQKRPSQEEQCV